MVSKDKQVVSDAVESPVNPGDIIKPNSNEASHNSNKNGRSINRLSDVKKQSLLNKQIHGSRIDLKTNS